MIRLPIAIFLLASFLSNDAYRKTVFHSLDPKSVAESLAFYELYPKTPEGEQALKRVELLLGGNYPLKNLSESTHKALQGIMALINRDRRLEEIYLEEEELAFIECLGSSLANRELLGYQAKTLDELLQISTQEIDLGKALLITQLEDVKQLRTYEAMLDLMALQIKAYLTPLSKPEEIIKEINHFVFEKMRFRFPPHSLYAKEVDRYTFLSSVLDNHVGVCLGVTTVYLAIAQRLGLSLELITPPGHIYIRYRDKDKIINIETTARGIDIPTSEYLSVGTKSLQQRHMKEVIGLTYINQASLYLHRKEYQKACETYEKALLFLPDDPFAEELLGFSYLFAGEEAKGRALLEKRVKIILEGSLNQDSRIEDYLNHKVDLKGLEAIFMEVDEKRATILKKQETLLKIVEEYPEFREGWVQLAVSYLQLNRNKEALHVLQKVHALDSQDPTVEYYLAELYFERYDFPKAWKHLKNAEQIVKEHQHSPKALREIRRKLLLSCPDPE